MVRWLGQAATVGLVVVLCGVLVVGTVRPAHAFGFGTPPGLPVVPPMVAPLTSGAATAGGVGAGAAGSAAAVGAAPVVAGVAAAAAVGGLVYVGWNRWESGEWFWEEGDDPAADELDSGEGGPSGRIIASYRGNSSQWASGARVSAFASDSSDVQSNNAVVLVSGDYDPDNRVFWQGDSGMRDDPWSSVFEGTVSDGEFGGETIPEAAYDGAHVLMLRADFVLDSPMTTGLDATWVTTADGDTIGADAPLDESAPTVRSEVTFSRPDGTTYSRTESVPYVPGSPQHEWPSVEGDESGDRVTEVEVERRSNVDGVPDESLVVMEPDTQLEQWLQDYPDCADGSCRVRLRVATDDGVKDCEEHPHLCRGWTGAPDREDRFECVWGPYDMPLGQCSALALRYDDPEGGPIEAPGVPYPDPDRPTQPGTGLVPRGDRITTTITRLRTDASSRFPFSVAIGLGEFFDGFGMGWDDGECPGWGSFIPDTLVQEGADPADGYIPCEPPDVPAWDLLYGGIAGFILLGGAWGLFAMGQSALGARSTGDGAA